MAAEDGCQNFMFVGLHNFFKCDTVFDEFSERQASGHQGNIWSYKDRRVWNAKQHLETVQKNNPMPRHMFPSQQRLLRTE